MCVEMCRCVCLVMVKVLRCGGVHACFFGGVCVEVKGYVLRHGQWPTHVCTPHTKKALKR